jgi:hypothetical protein
MASGQFGPDFRAARHMRSAAPPRQAVPDEGRRMYGVGMVHFFGLLTGEPR